MLLDQRVCTRRFIFVAQVSKIIFFSQTINVSLFLNRQLFFGSQKICLCRDY